MQLKTKIIPLFFVFLMSVEFSNLEVPGKAGITSVPGAGIPEMAGVPGPDPRAKGLKHLGELNNELSKLGEKRLQFIRMSYY